MLFIQAKKIDNNKENYKIFLKAKERKKKDVKHKMMKVILKQMMNRKERKITR